MSILKRIFSLKSEKNRLLKEIFQIKLMIPGSFKEVYRKCGKKNCWCQDDTTSGHPYRRITWSENGQVKTKAIPEEDINWIKEVTQNYRDFRNKRSDYTKLENRVKKLIDEYAKDIIQNTRKLRKYL